MTEKRSTDAPAKRGRPRAVEPGMSVSTWIRTTDHDRLIRLAQEHDTSVSAVVRQLLAVKLR